MAHCNDCHVPQNNAFNKYFFKAKDGRCHEDQVTDARLLGLVPGHRLVRTYAPEDLENVSNWLK